MILCNFRGEIITPCDIDYNKDRQIWNRAIQKYPCAIAYCENACDVSYAVKYATENHIPIRIRSGGHNYEGYSVGNKVLVVDVSLIDSININNCQHIVTVGGGVKLAALYEVVARQGYPFPGGTCPTVGVSGFCLGGGWGLSARKFGLGCDSLLEVEMVDYRGNILTVNECCNPDLFWALRGAGGGNFGVVVSMKFRLPAKTGNITYFELYYPRACLQTQLKFLEIFQKWILAVSPDINMTGGIYNTKEDGIYIFVRGICYGDPEKTRRLLCPFYFTNSLEDTFQYGSFLQIINRVESVYPPSEKFKSTGRFVTRYYSRRELENLLHIVNQPRPRGSLLTSLSIYGLGGHVREVRPCDTAFYFRDAHYILLIQSVWENSCVAPDNQKWVLENFPVLYRLTVGSYINFPLLQLPNYMANYFGGNACSLIDVKNEYDPCSVFTFPQSIPIC